MKFRKKISFSIIGFKILLESLVCSFPHTFSSNAYINEDSWNVIHDPVCDALHFQGNNKSPIQCKSHLRCFPNNNYIKGNEYTSSEKVDNEFIIPPEFSSAPNYRDLCNFPEVEYPLSAREMWKPNYWTSYSTDYSNKNVNTDYVNSMLNEHSKVKSMHNFETKFKPGKIATKSFSDSKKNLATLKAKALKDFKNDSSHDNKTRNQNENTNIPLDNTSKLCNYYTTVAPSDVNRDVRLKDKNVLEHKTNVLNIDDASYLNTQPELLLAYSEVFKKEIESILKTMADNIILTKFESSKNKIPSKETFNDKWELNSTLINDIAEEFDKEMTLKIKSVADNIRNKIDLTKYINQKTEHDKNHLKPDILCEEFLISTTQAPKLTDDCAVPKTNDFIMDTKEATCKESDNVKHNNNTCPFSPVNNLSPSTNSGNDITRKKEASEICKSETNIINEMDKEEEISVPDDTEKQNIIQSVSNISDQEISLEEDFTTDSYPENNDEFYALSTVAPPILNGDMMWRDTNIIEPDKSLAYPDELDQYFLLSSD